MPRSLLLPLRFQFVNNYSQLLLMKNVKHTAGLAMTSSTKYVRHQSNNLRVMKRHIINPL